MRIAAPSVFVALLLCLSSTSALAEDWVVAKTTGQVWHAPAQAQPVSLGAETRLAPGDLIQTGPNGRVMLTRGSERILVSPNSVISLPKVQDKPGFTTILQQAGAVAIEAEKKDQKHFEVLTPYLAAVVKGTQFTVTVGKGAANVNVASGKVEVADVKSGKTALVLPGQFAKVGAATGLSLGGSGRFEPITQGAPRSATPSTVTVPAQGLKTPPKVEGGLRVDNTRAAPPATTNVVRIEKALGPVSLDAGVATAGLVRSQTGVGSHRGTIWKPAAGDTSAAAASASNANANSSGSNGTSASANGIAASSGAAAGVSAAPGAGVAAGIGGGNGAAAVAGTPAASAAAAAGGVNASFNAGVSVKVKTDINEGKSDKGGNVGNAFGLNGGNGIGKAIGLSKKN